MFLLHGFLWISVVGGTFCGKPLSESAFQRLIVEGEILIPFKFKNSISRKYYAVLCF